MIVGQIWIWILQPDWGLLNAFLSAGHLSAHQFHYAWLGEAGNALWSVIVAWSWQQTGLSW